MLGIKIATNALFVKKVIFEINSKMLLSLIHQKRDFIGEARRGGGGAAAGARAAAARGGDT